MARVTVARAVGDIFADNCDCSDRRERQENKASYLKPELVQNIGKMAHGGANATEDRPQRTAAPYVLASDAGGDAEFASCGNACHYSRFYQPRGLEWLAETVIFETACWRWHLTGSIPGGSVDQQLKQLMKELGEAINESLADSDQIAEVVSRIKDGGYDIFLVLEATIGVSRPGEKGTDKSSLVTTLSSNPDLKISDQDLKFLKSLRIKIEDDAA